MNKRPRETLAPEQRPCSWGRRTEAEPPGGRSALREVPRGGEEVKAEGTEQAGGPGCHEGGRTVGRRAGRGRPGADTEGRGGLPAPARPVQVCVQAIRSLLAWFSFLSLQEFEKLSDFFKTHYRLELMEKDLCVKGWNWGTVKFGGESCGRLRFRGRRKDERFPPLTCLALSLLLPLISCPFVNDRVFIEDQRCIRGSGINRQPLGPLRREPTVWWERSLC